MASFSNELPAGENSAAADAATDNATHTQADSHDLASGPDAGGVGSDLVQALLLSDGDSDAHFLSGGDLGSDTSVYDGHVALATIDSDAPADIGHALDLLTTSHDLFDVPAIDGLHGHDVLPT